MKIDLSKIYQPIEKQKLAHSSKERFCFFGGAMRGGKSVWGCNEGLQLSLDYPGNRGLICRWELSSLKRTTLKTLFEFLPSELIKNHNKSEGEIELINGSVIFYMGLKSSKSINALERLKSLELGWFFIDEATEVEKKYFDLLKTRLSLKLPNGRHPYYRGLLASNPEPGWVRETFIDQKLDDHIFIPALPKDNPHLDPNYIENLTKDLPSEMIKKYLEGSWDVIEGNDYVFPYSLVKQAVERKLERTEPKETGIDIARFGGDSNVVAIREGAVVRIVYESKYQDTMRTAGEIGLILEKENPSISKIDAVGIGAGSFDRLKEQGFNVAEIIGGSSPRDKERFYNARSENHWGFREKLEAGLVDLPNDTELISELCGIKYKIMSDRRIKVESKEEMKKRGLKSPDKADAVIMSFIGQGAKRRDVPASRVFKMRGYPRNVQQRLRGWKMTGRQRPRFIKPR